MKGCAVCGKPVRLVARHRFCSPDCFYISRRVVRSKACRRCGAERPLEWFGLDRTRPDGLNTWCKPCWRVYRDGHLPKDRELRLEWDGETRYSDVRILRPYQVICLQAGHLMWHGQLTEFQAARIVILGFRTRCGVCGGWLMLESEEDGGISGGVQLLAPPLVLAEGRVPAA